MANPLPNFTDSAETLAIAALTRYALANGATERELSESRVATSNALSKHIDRVEQSLRCCIDALTVATQNVLEECRAVAGALAWAYGPEAWAKCDRDVWAVARAFAS